MIFISYSRDDIRWRDIFKKKLSVICRQRGLNTEKIFWHDGYIESGNPNWKAAIDDARARSKSVLFLYSENFEASDFIAREEYQYFMDRRNQVDIYWLVLDRIPYTNSQLYRSNIQACVPASGRITPLIDMTEPELQEFLFKSLDSIVVKDLKRNDKDSLQQTNLLRSGAPASDFIIDNRVFNCNRTKETEIFEHCFHFYKNACSVLSFAIDGDQNDLLDTLGQTIWFRSMGSLNGRGNDVRIIKLDKIADSLPNNALPNKDFIIRSLKIKLLKQLYLPISLNEPLTLDGLSGLLNNRFYIIVLAIKSTYFNRHVYDTILEWIATEFTPQDRPGHDLKAAFFFSFERAGAQLEDELMLAYLKERIQKTDFYNMIYYSGSKIPDLIAANELIYLGAHKPVTRSDIEDWLVLNTHVDRVHLDELFDFGEFEAGTMKTAVRKLDRFIREYNQLIQ